MTTENKKPMQPREFIRSIAEGSETSHWVDVETLYIDPKFARDEYGDLNWLADKITREGFRKDREISVRIRQDLGKLEVLDGRHRTLASKLAKENKGFNGLVLVKYKSGVDSDVDVLTETLTAQIGSKPFTPSELGKYFNMLISEYGKTVEQVAEIVGRTPQHVYEMIRFHKMDGEQKAVAEELIKSGRTTKTAVLTLMKKGVDLKSLKGKTGKITVQSATQSTSGKIAYITPRRVRDTLKNVQIAAASDPKWEIAIGPLLALLEDKTWSPAYEQVKTETT